MCKKFTSDEFDNVVETIKEKCLSKTNMPKLIIGSGLSMSYNLPGMQKLFLKLDKEIGAINDKSLNEFWLPKTEKIKLGGLEAGLQDIANYEKGLVQVIKNITAKYILEEELKLHNNIMNDDSGFKKLMCYLRDTCSVNSRIVDIMTPNYDRVIELVCDSLGINLINGFEGCVYKRFNANVIKKPKSRTNTTNAFSIRLFKPHGSLDWLKRDEVTEQVNDTALLFDNIDKIEIVTPGCFKYEIGMLNPMYRVIREDFNDVLTNSSESFSLFIYGYGFNDEHFNNVLYECFSKNVIIISRDVNSTIINKAKSNEKINLFYQENGTNFIIYKCHKYISELALWNLDVFSDIFFS